MIRVKHVIRDGRAFTSDNILVYKLVVDNLPEIANLEVVQTYFGRYGGISNANTSGRGDYRKFFLHFADPEGAANALLEANHFIMGCLVRVEACHSLHQPDGIRLVREVDMRSLGYHVLASVPERQELVSILVLNDHCLEEICRRLNASDQLSFALSCNRMFLTFVALARVEYVEFNTKTIAKWSLLNMRIFLKIVGPNVKCLSSSWSRSHCDYYGNQTLKYLALYCTNVENLSATQWNRTNSIRGLIANMPRLCRIELRCVQITNKFFSFLKSFINLKYLGIIENVDISGANIHLHTKLEELSLRRCTNLIPWHFWKICINLSYLTSLDIREIKQLQRREYQLIFSHLKLLRRLALTCYSKSYTCLAKLPRLTALDIFIKLVDDTETIDFFGTLAMYNAKKMEELKRDGLTSNCRIPRIMVKFKNLRVLYISYQMVNDGNNMVFLPFKNLVDLYLTHCDSMTDEVAVDILRNNVNLVHFRTLRAYNLTSYFLSQALVLLQEQRAQLLRSKRLHLEINTLNCICGPISKHELSLVMKLDCSPHYMDHNTRDDI